MKKLVFFIIILLLCAPCFGQEKEQPKSAFTYSVGLAYNQIWLQSNLYGTDEYGIVSSSPFNWGITPYFSMVKGRLVFSAGLNYSSCSLTKERFSDYYETDIVQDKWQEASLASAVGFQVTGEYSLMCVIPFLGIDLTYLINYEKDVITDVYRAHYNTNQLKARDTYDIGLGALGGAIVSYPIAKHFAVGLTYCVKFKILNDIRNDNNPHDPHITSPVLYHTANLNFSYRFN